MKVRLQTLLSLHAHLAEATSASALQGFCASFPLNTAKGSAVQFALPETEENLAHFGEKINRLPKGFAGTGISMSGLTSQWKIDLLGAEIKRSFCDYRVTLLPLARE